MPADDFTTAKDPFSVFECWFDEAKDRELNDPDAMALCTVDEAGMPNARMVLLKGIDGADALERGVVFYTNAESVKGRELQQAGVAALLFHWKSLRRQVRMRGRITTVSDDEADAYFASRSRASRIGAWASDQSRPLQSRGELEGKVAEIEEKLRDQPVPRPPHWRGFRLIPLEFELWQDGPHRLHDRVLFVRETATSSWHGQRLYP